MFRRHLYAAAIFSFVVDCFKPLIWWLSALLRPRHELAAEIVALRSQLALYQQMVAKQNLPVRAALLPFVAFGRSYRDIGPDGRMPYAS